MSSLDSIGGIDQSKIVQTETREISEISANKKTLLVDRVKLFWNKTDQKLRWEIKDNNIDTDFSEPLFPENEENNLDYLEKPEENMDEVEVDLTGVGNGRPILGLTETGTFRVLETTSSEGEYQETYEYPEDVIKIVDLNSNEWIISPNHQEIIPNNQEILSK